MRDHRTCGWPEGEVRSAVFVALTMQVDMPGFPSITTPGTEKAGTTTRWFSGIPPWVVATHPSGVCATVSSAMLIRATPWVLLGIAPTVRPLVRGSAGLNAKSVWLLAAALAFAISCPTVEACACGGSATALFDAAFAVMSATLDMLPRGVYT